MSIKLSATQTITDKLSEIKKQTGVVLTPCDHFTGIKESKGGTYFCANLTDNRISESLDYERVSRYAMKYKGFRIEPCGIQRVAIFIQQP